MTNLKHCISGTSKVLSIFFWAFSLKKRACPDWYWMTSRRTFFWARSFKIGASCQFLGAFPKIRASPDRSWLIEKFVCVKIRAWCQFLGACPTNRLILTITRIGSFKIGVWRLFFGKFPELRTCPDRSWLIEEFTCFNLRASRQFLGAFSKIRAWRQLLGAFPKIRACPDWCWLIEESSCFKIRAWCHFFGPVPQDTRMSRLMLTDGRVHLLKIYRILSLSYVYNLVYVSSSQVMRSQWARHQTS